MKTSIINGSEVSRLSVAIHSELQLVCESTQAKWQSQGEQILKDTGLTLADWQPIYQALSQNQEPVLTPEQQKRLVDKGIVKMRLTFATGL